MATIKKNKEIIQSYILTTAKYNFSVYEKRVLYRIIEMNQFLIAGKKLNEKYQLNSTPHGNIEYTMPIHIFLKDGDNTNHKEVKKAFKSLQKKELIYKDKHVLSCITIIALPKIDKYSETVKFTIDRLIYNALIDFSKGFRKFELKIAMQFESSFSMRFYELLSNQHKPINYRIETLKEMFKITNKYKFTSNFIQKVIETAKKELDRCSPYTFHYEAIKTGRKITSIRFIPIYQPQFEDEELKRQRLNKRISNHWFISKNIEDYLKYNFEFNEKELNNNLNLFESLSYKLTEDETLDFLLELRNQIISYNTKNIKGYIIGALKKKNEEEFTKLYKGK